MNKAWLLVGGALALTACQRFSDADAVALVRRYNERNIEAFRTGDAQLTEETSGTQEGKKLLGLIGVRLDSGTVLDSGLLEFDVSEVIHVGANVQVLTRERWRWSVRRMSDGGQVGGASDDLYTMRYTLGQEHGRWVVLSTEHASPPVMSRPREQWRAPVRDLHGLPSKLDPGPSPPAAPPASAPTGVQGGHP